MTGVEPAVLEAEGIPAAAAVLDPVQHANLCPQHSGFLLLDRTQGTDD